MTKQTSPARLIPDIETIDELRPLVPAMNGDGDFRYGQDDADIAHDNLRRARFAALAVLAFADETFAGGSDENFDTVIGDLIADLMHLSDALGLDFGSLLEKGRFHYLPELAGEL